MPGAFWSDVEREILSTLIATGLGPTEILRSGRLPGRTINSIKKELGRLNLANPERSARVSRGKTEGLLSDKQYSDLCAYIRKYGPTYNDRQLARAWNKLQKQQEASGEVPILMRAGRIQYYRNKLRVPRPPQGKARKLAQKKLALAAKPPVSKQEQGKQRRRKHDAAQEKLFQALLLRRETILAAEPETPLQLCQACKESFPLTEEFFEKILHRKSGVYYFVKLRCAHCQKQLEREKRRAKEDQGIFAVLAIDRTEDARYFAARQQQAQQTREAARVRRHELSKSDPKISFKKCAQCQEPWPKSEDFFPLGEYANANGSRKLFSICNFCDREYQMALSRSKKDDKFEFDQIKEARQKALVAARDKIREQRRTAARKLRTKIFTEEPDFPKDRCHTCQEQWPITKDFWFFRERTGSCSGRRHEPGLCRFCRAETQNVAAEKSKAAASKRLADQKRARKG